MGLIQSNTHFKHKMAHKSIWNISCVSNIKANEETPKQEIPAKPKDRNLTCNEEETEEYEIKLTGNEDWRKCKSWEATWTKQKIYKEEKIWQLIH